MRQHAIITDGRTLRGMQIAGFIEWNGAARDRHWTGATVRRVWVHPGPKLTHTYQRFTHRGREYQLQYFDGCFHPFVTRVGVPVPSFV